jgi:peptidyl-prolyl cis-trans isomerase A (cyclophilin A)
LFQTVLLKMTLLMLPMFIFGEKSAAQTNTNGSNPSPFSVQIPTNQPTLPAGVLPQQGAQRPYTPMALPPSSGGYAPNAQLPGQIPNTYNTPGLAPTPAAQTSSEIILFNPKVELQTVLVMKTSEGDFKITLQPDIAPKNVENFIELALGQKEFVDVRTGKKVKRPFYTGLNCHRVLKSVLIQCGCPFGNGTGGPGFRIGDERSTAMRFDRPGVIAMALARAPDKGGLGYEANSAGSQFFISLAPLPDFNGQFTVIGRITSGMDTIRKIAESPTGPTDRPLKRVIIFSVDPDLPPLPPLAPVVDPMAPSDPMSAPPISAPAVPALPSGTIDPFAAPAPPPQSP